ncbi:MAG: histamine oxidase, partial [Brevibacterium sp.]|nr:histamine oxidase [Brevibacterium sp.]
MSCHSIPADPSTPTALTPFSLPTEAELATVTSVIREAGHFPAEARLTYVGLLDPVRGQTRAGAEVNRRFRALLLDKTARTARAIIVSTPHGRLASV